ncbi:hypothetical protein, partial [Christensenella minuta]|uniref:hypothetical protein n=1 Tax=Christensenella minuta TaxID=626937 RepID=UPI001A9A6052
MFHFRLTPSVCPAYRNRGGQIQIMLRIVFVHISIPFGKPKRPHQESFMAFLFQARYLYVAAGKRQSFNP